MMTVQRALFVFILLELLMSAGCVWMYGFTNEALQTATRFSGRLSLLVFSVLFLWQHDLRLRDTWLSPQPYLIYAVVHGIHLIILLAYTQITHATLVPMRVAAGALAYALTLAMPYWHRRYTQGTWSARNFITAETIFIYYSWLMFFMTYLSRVQGTVPFAGGTYREHVVLLAWVSTMLGFKLSAMFRQKPQRLNRRD